ncbi:hypothetical protein PLESTB_000482400 [Pleodorina starrii]|uniref:PHD-type domain-containing protein n=1 Tax=Pleodorina starrii TaxID=330485 RepID=A0A9W6BFF5_9CHLO|nr:hypothetical protein PLESTM_001584000 [Pleodorina starrii]GLC51251.1 hypothetical protein PLESTB_000482400 [Pleodorina starrii]GLC63610.1 hypothetical protein PLESTF_000054800 [Pleodorina starrii]
MEPAAAEPPAKRQRKEPAWKAVFVDSSKWKDIKDASATTAAAAAAAATPEGGDGPPAANAISPSTGAGEDEPTTKVLSSRPLDFNRAEVTVLHKGKRYRGIVERTGLPQSIGVATQVTKEELAAIAAAPPHGENPSNMCALCNTALEVAPVHGISDDKAHWYLKVRITSNWTARVHLQCAVWCPECKEDPYVPGYYHHMGPAVRRGRALRCKDCKQRGATVGCFQEGCPAVYHLTCAVSCGCAFNEGTMEVWCPQHIR